MILVRAVCIICFVQIWVLQKHVHASWLISYLCVGIIIGVIISRAMKPIDCSLLVLFAICIASAVCLWVARVWCIPLILALGGILGLWRGGIELSLLEPYKILVGHSVVIVGKITQDPTYTEKQTNVELDGIQVSGQSLGGKMWVSIDGYKNLKRSDGIVVKGKLGKGFGNISASIFNARLLQIKRLSQNDLAGKVRDRFSQAVRQTMPDEQADLGLGFLTGQKSTLSADFSEDLKNVGLTHVVVASGYNLSILVRLARRLFSRVSKYMAAYSGSAMAVGMTLITGLSPSMVRAASVTGLSLLAWYYGRKFHPLVLLLLVGAVTLLFDPSFIWGDLGWELSFAAFAGVMIIAPILQVFFFGDKKPGAVRQIIGETVAAELMTLPIIILAFGQFSNISIVANLLILPFVPLAMLLTFMTGVGTLLAPFMAAIISMPATWLLSYMIECINFLAAMPGVKTSLSMNVIVVFIYYAVLFGWWLYAWRRTKYNLREASLVE